VNAKAPSALPRSLEEATAASALARSRLAGAASVSWRVNAERIVLLGWGRAILLQLAHPLVAAGVFGHSSFRATPWAAASRLYHTVHAMLALTFGSDDDRERALDAIRAIHRRVNGVLEHGVGAFPAGTRYSAEDPALVVWVHATLIESVILTYEHLVAPLSAEERDAYCEEAFPIAVALAARAQDVPRRWDDLRSFMERMHASGALAVGSHGRELSRAVLSPAGGWAVAPASWVNRVVTIGLLPSGVRQQYGLAWTERDERKLARILSCLRATRRVLPDALALWPDARRRRT
jgi:uncharacterized protein (DUF2236 family)